jgi:hypothetical protein
MDPSRAAFLRMSSPVSIAISVILMDGGVETETDGRGACWPSSAFDKLGPRLQLTAAHSSDLLR